MDEKYINRCLQLAKKGLATVAPNPMVGCVIVYNNKIIGEGWHQKYGEAHAETNAINSVKDKSLLSKSTLYVNLEPCAHFGKTPPCTDIIIKCKIPKVVIGCIDVFSSVNGKGIKKLRRTGCEVKVNVLEKECKELNKRFFVYHKYQRPYITLKYATSQDGFLDTVRIVDDIEQAKVNWISNEYSRQLAHKYRTQESAILVGTNTVLNDNPKLNVRDWYGNNPIRVILDRELKIPTHYKVYNSSVKTMFFTAYEKENRENIVFEIVDFSDENILEFILNKLYHYGIQSLIVEGGAKVLNSFVSKGLWDCAKVFVSQMKFYEGLKVPQIHSSFLVDRISIENDVLYYYKHC